MIDKTTAKPMRVKQEGRSGPYLTIPVEQVEEVKKVLDQARIRYWVAEIAISINGRPATTVVNFGKTMDPQAIQSELDGAN